MNIILHRNFKGRYKKLKTSEQMRVKERLALFLSDEFNPALNNHPLRGKYNGYRSINITGDLRAIYKFQSPDVRIFVTLGTHHALYE
jgi:addiction module RelE/StbE family toxin